MNLSLTTPYLKTSLLSENFPDVNSGGKYPSVLAMTGAVTTVLFSVTLGKSIGNPKSLIFAKKLQRFPSENYEGLCLLKVAILGGDSGHLNPT